MGQVASSHLSGMGTQLIKASKAGDADAVTELVSSNPRLLRYCTFRHLGPCHYAARGDHVEVLQQLVAKAQEIEQLQGREAAASSAQVHARLVGSVVPTPAAAAAATAAQPHHRQQQPQQQQQPPSPLQPHNSLVKQLVNATSDRGVTPLMLAVDGGCIASVRLLLENGADPWAVDKLGGRTALHYAARGDNPDMLQLLAEAAGSSGPVQFPNRPNTSYVDVRTQTGFTAIHFAVQSNSRQALAVLLNLGANPLLSSLFDCLDVINCPKGTTALHLAARQGNEAVAKQLLRTYVEHWYQRHLPDPRLLLDGDNLLPCQVAARRNHAETARMLLPSNPITSLFSDGDLNLVGPPSLAAIAGAVLRSTLNGDLQQLLMQQQQQQHGVHSAQDEEQQQDEEQEDEEAESDAAAAMTAATAAAEAAPVAEEGCQQSEDASVDAADDDDSSSTASSSSEDACGEVCGVCFDEPPQVLLSPCGHQLCAGCCQSLLDLNSRCVLMCPFCRAGVAHLQPVAGAAAAAAAVGAHKVAGCGAVGCGNTAGVVAVGVPAAALVPTPEPAVALTNANQLVV